MFVDLHFQEDKRDMVGDFLCLWNCTAAFYIFCPHLLLPLSVSPPPPPSLNPSSSSTASSYAFFLPLSLLSPAPWHPGHSKTTLPQSKALWVMQPRNHLCQLPLWCGGGTGNCLNLTTGALWPLLHCNFNHCVVFHRLSLGLFVTILFFPRIAGKIEWQMRHFSNWEMPWSYISMHRIVECYPVNIYLNKSHWYHWGVFLRMDGPGS